MEIVVMIAQLLLGISILVGLHELGHLLAAKAFGMRVEKYSIGFPPKIWGFKYGETEYSIGAIPLGGFVKISGMIDESMDKKQMAQEPQPWEFRSKPAWQRLIVMMGGIIVNVITGIVIYVTLAFANGETYIAKDEMNKHGIVAYNFGEQLGFRTGDKVVNINGQDFDKFSDLLSPEVIMSSKGYYTVERNGKQETINIPSDFLNLFADKSFKGNFIDIRRKFVVDKVVDGKPGYKAGLRAGDKIVAINGKPIAYYHELKQSLTENAGLSVNLIIDRNGSKKEFTAKLGDEGLLGFYPDFDLNLSHSDYSFAQSLSIGTKEAFGVVWVNIQGFGKMFRGEVDPRKSLSGPVGIAKMYGGEWIWDKFWKMTGLLSMVLAFMNFLPIPALDGGHVMFLTFEMVSGRKPSDKFLENAQKVGMVILLLLMSFAFLNDFFK